MISRKQIEDMLENIDFKEERKFGNCFCMRLSKDYHECVYTLQELNKITYEMIKNFKPNQQYKTYWGYLRSNISWKIAKLLQCLNNVDLWGGILTCKYCKKPINSMKGIVMHHEKYDIKNYFGSFGSQDVCIVHYNCHKKIHGWD